MQSHLKPGGVSCPQDVSWHRVFARAAAEEQAQTSSLQTCPEGGFGQGISLRGWKLSPWPWMWWKRSCSCMRDQVCQVVVFMDSKIELWGRWQNKSVNTPIYGFVCMLRLSPIKINSAAKKPGLIRQGDASVQIQASVQHMLNQV